MIERFIGRTAELDLLQDTWRRNRGELLLLYGRRRIGKTYLLQHFVGDRPAVFYQATRQAEPSELAGFTEQVGARLGPLPPGYLFPSWEAALRYLDEHATNRLIVILDEFPYLCESTPGLPSVIQRWWDQRGRRSSIMLVLCGSAQTFMADLESGGAPLHQRFTTRIALKPLTYLEAAEFTPGLSAQDRARVYGLLGGTPLFLKEWREAQSVRENLLALYGTPSGLLVDSARLALHADLGDATASYRALSAIANGATRRNEILDRAKITNERVLQRLDDLGLAIRRVPVTEGTDSRRGTYLVADPYFRFWFRCVEPNLAAIDRGFGERLVDSVLLPGLENHMGLVFEDLARAYATRLVASGDLEGLDLGPWWSRDGQHEVDIVGVLRKRPTFIGTVKWQASRLGINAYRNLAGHARALDVDESIPWLMFGRNGVDAQVLSREPHVRGYSVDDIYDRT